ncbi:MAG: EAL domain-containing protein [Gammaproteobacteria bacterium]|nr:EAL domain-containing protein [Gammaproteobacteria bacterium]
MPYLTMIAVLSVLLQFTAVIFALRLIPLTRKAMAWTLLSIAFLLMASRRTIDLLFGQNIFQDPVIHNYSTKTVALIISIFIVSGVYFTKRIFEQQKRDAEQLRKFCMAVEQSSSATVIFTPAGIIEYVNPKFCEINQTTAEQLAGKKPGFLTTKCTPQSTLNKIWNRINIGGTWKSEFYNKDADGQDFWSRAVISPIKNDKDAITFFIATFEDITIEKRQQQAIKELSLHDNLTQLPNRKLFHNKLQQAIEVARTGEQMLAVLLLDINNFKAINNSLGHLAGDVILRDIANRLNHISQQDHSHTLARMGGDEFLLFTTNTSHDKTTELASQLYQSISQPFYVENRNFELSANIGYAMYPEHGDSAEKLIKNADIAMYAAKGSSRNIIKYSPSLDDGKLKRLELSSHFRQAAMDDEFVLYYQPQMDFKNGRIIGAEALIRWLHPEYGLLPPDDFIELAEQSGHIYMITEWIISHALQQLAEWHNNGHDIQLSVNISATDIQNPELVSLLETEMIRHKIEPAWLKLEITENSLMLYTSQTTSALSRITELGIAISIDDFGTGYSSLQYLTKMPVTHIKIDKSFVMQMLISDQDAVIVRSTIDLAHNLGLLITAEGIENQETHDILEILGCDYAQGHHLAKPMNNKAYMNWLSLFNTQSTVMNSATVPA